MFALERPVERGCGFRPIGRYAHYSGAAGWLAVNEHQGARTYEEGLLHVDECVARTRARLNVLHVRCGRPMPSVAELHTGRARRAKQIRSCGREQCGLKQIGQTVQVHIDIGVTNQCRVAPDGSLIDYVHPNFDGTVSRVRREGLPELPDAVICFAADYQRGSAQDYRREPEIASDDPTVTVVEILDAGGDIAEAVPFAEVSRGKMLETRGRFHLDDVSIRKQTSTSLSSLRIDSLK